MGLRIDEYVLALEELVSFKSVKGNFIEIDKCLNFFKQFFVEVEGLKVDIFEFNGVKSIYFSFNNYEPDVLFNGHLDVVPGSEEIFKMKRDGDKIVGRGVNDMKGMCLLMATFLKENWNNGRLKGFGFLLNTDEEIGGFNGASKIVSESLIRPKYIFVPDSGNDFVLISKLKGVLQLDITTKGVNAHGARTWLGVNAINKMVKVANLLSEKLDDSPTHEYDWQTSVNFGEISGGTAINQTPDECKMSVDIRFTDKWNLESLKSYVENLIGGLADFEIRMTTDVCITDVEHDFFKKARESIKFRFDKDAFVGIAPGQCDARFFIHNNIPALIFKPICGAQHSETEWGLLNSYEVFYDVLNDVFG